MPPDSIRRRRAKHRMGTTPEYYAWRSMKKRCYNETDSHYPDYGARGIKVCARWLGKDGFLNFFADMGLRPSSDHSLDRVDNNGSYTPENCRWATRSEQAQNRRIRSDRERYEFEGQWLTTAQLAERVGLKYHTLRYRLRTGQSVEEAVKPVLGSDS